VRSTLKGLFELLLLHGGPAALSRRRLGGRRLVLAYHNVVEDGQAGPGESSLHLPLRAFRAQLAALDELAQTVPLSSLLDSTVSRDGASSGKRPRVAITFDDAYRGAVTLGLPELSRRGMPATVFVSPGRLGGERFWWDRFASEAPGDNSAFRDTALRELGGDETRVSAWADTRGWRGTSLPDEFGTVSEADLEAALRLPGVSLASHSWSHPNLTELDDADLEAELTRPLEWLETRFAGSTIPWLAYPYGIADGRVAEAAATAGYEAALRVEGGWLPTQISEPFMLPRLNVPAGLSATGFRCRLSGLLCKGA